MATTYIQLKLTISPLESGQEIALAFLGEMGFESFIETAQGLEAYIPEQSWFPDLLDELYPLVENGLDIGWSLTAIPPENWNAVWESDFQPIRIENKCAVRADFHAPIDVPFELVITPKMSFGTGHHQTTYMMLNYLLNHPPKDQLVLDMGCGTGVLAILAEKLGAAFIDAIDVEPWCFENTVENIAMNDCKNINAMEGDREVIPEKNYGTIIANINLNVLLLDIPLFAKQLLPNGKLFLSGFYTHDIPAIESKANQNGLQMVDYQEKDNWVAAHFYKK
jgi:ribosomal protein L11 methyltransferase